MTSIPDNRRDSAGDNLFVPEKWLERTGTEYFLVVKGDCMAPAGIKSGDLVGVKSQDTADDGDVVAARTPAGKVIKTYRHVNGRAFLVPADSHYPSIPAGDAVILGVVTGVIHVFADSNYLNT